MGLELTGSLIMTGSFLSLSFLAAAGLLKFHKLLSTVYDLDNLGRKFEILWKRPGEFVDSTSLLNLSYTYSSLKRQLKIQGEADIYTLRRALKNAKKRKSIFPSDETERLHFAAWRKFEELRSRLE